MGVAFFRECYLFSTKPMSETKGKKLGFSYKIAGEYLYFNPADVFMF